MSATPAKGQTYVGIDASKFTIDMVERIDNAIELLKPEAVEMVQRTPKLCMTLNHYAYWAQCIDMAPNAIGKICLANALVRAGANRQGVLDAFILIMPS